MPASDLQPSSYCFPKNPILFRYCFLFIVLFIIQWNNSAYPLLSFIIPHYPKINIPVIEWLGGMLGWPNRVNYLYYDKLFGLTKYEWLTLLQIGLYAIVGTAIWSWLARRKSEMIWARYTLTVLIRYYIGLMLINYGIIKLFKTQFPSPFFLHLIKPLGEFTPMELTWAFYGYSTGFNIFIGLVEVSAVFLLFRRTATLGALLSFAASLNILLLNIFYDIPVTLIASALTLLSLYLLVPNLQRIYIFLVKGQASQLIAMPNIVLKNKIWRTVKLVLKYIIIVHGIALYFHHNENSKKFIAKMNAKDFALNGAYYIAQDQEPQRTALAIPSKWAYFCFLNEETLIIQQKYGGQQKYVFEINQQEKTLKIIGKTGERGIDINYHILENGDLEWSSREAGNSQKVRLTKYRDEESKLLSH